MLRYIETGKYKQIGHYQVRFYNSFCRSTRKQHPKKPAQKKLIVNNYKLLLADEVFKMWYMESVTLVPEVIGAEGEIPKNQNESLIKL